MESVGPQLPKSYDADGVLTESVVFPGNAVTPKRWAVHDPDTNRVTAYVQCSSGDVKLDDYVGQHVGITGSMKYERDLKLYIVEAKDVTVLKADAKLPAPPEPTVKPPPKDQPPVDATPRPEAPKAEQPKMMPTTAPAAKETPTPKPVAVEHVSPDMGEPAAPDATPKEPGKASETPTTGPATKPADSKALPPTGLKTADEK